MRPKWPQELLNLTSLSLLVSVARQKTLKCLQDAARRHQEGSNTAQDGPKTLVVDIIHLDMKYSKSFFYFGSRLC